ncbi:MAG TPA: Ig-like domain-containing protein [Gemmatimonadaceae bacterium]|nr:Ig-like domain-containing protein [Gemmatimonadaceae bacterium]
MTLLAGARRGLALLVVTLAGAACGGSDPKQPSEPTTAVATVTVSADSVRLVVGGTAQLSAQMKAADGVVLTRPVVWTSSAPNVAEVSATGLVTARDLGVATITATSEGKSAAAFATSHIIRSTREYREWFPRVVDASRSTDVVLTAVADAATDRVQLALAGGTNLRLAKLPGGNAYGLTVRSDRLLAGYQQGDLHQVVGFFDFYTGAQRTTRLNAAINVRDATVAAATVTALAPDAQASAHVANLRYDNLYFGAAAPSDMTRRFYALFPDVFDFLTVVEQVQSTNNRNYVGVRNRVKGIGLALAEDTGNRGSASKLQGTIQFPIDGLFDLGETAAIHEIGHAFINFLAGSPMASGIPHWPMSSVASGIMGGSQGPTRQGVVFPYRLVPLPGGDYRTEIIERPTEYNDLELYMMGLAAGSEIGAQFTFVDQDQNPASGLLRGPVIPFTIDSLVNRFGARDPAYPAAPSSFRVGTIVLSAGRLLSADEMAYFDHMAARGEATTPLTYTSGLARGTTKPFYVATRQRGRLVTTVR